MNDLVIKDVEKELNWKEKVIVKIFAKTFNKVYSIARIKTVNNILK